MSSLLIFFICLSRSRILNRICEYRALFKRGGGTLEKLSPSIYKFYISWSLEINTCKQCCKISLVPSRGESPHKMVVSPKNTVARIPFKYWLTLNSANEKNSWVTRGEKIPLCNVMHGVGKVKWRLMSMWQFKFDF